MVEGVFNLVLALAREQPQSDDLTLLVAQSPG